MSVSTGWAHTCAVLANGSLKCWGSNGYGEIDQASAMGYPSPVTPRSVPVAQAAALGWRQSCWLVSGAAVCDSFYVVPPLTGVQALTAHMVLCARMNTGTVKCWGSNGSGDLGDGTTTSDYGAWHDVLNLTNVSSLETGGFSGGHTCAVMNGGVWCWGANAEGQLGIAKTTTFSSTPVQVPGITTARQVALGGGYSCAVLTDNTVRCWGLLPNGALGTGTHTVQTISGWTGVTSVAAGYAFVCALRSGQVYCFGSNSTGQLGGSSATTPVTGLTNVTALAAGDQHVCVVQTSGDVRCWGLNSSGQLGNGTGTDSSTPVRAGP